MNKLLEYYEKRVREDSSLLAEENLRLTEYITELRDAWENRAVLRHLRALASMRICNGDGLCLATPTSHCMNGVHETCPEHTGSCYLCLPKDSL
jgi:hypothetical protein